MPLFDRHFTVSEARAEIPRLQEELIRLQRAVESLEETQPAAEAAATTPGQNGGSHGASKHLAQREEIAAIIASINERGIQIKDPRRGLVDFPHLREGREVLLCFLLGEEDIRYWHDIESGFRGRRPL